MTLYAPKGLRVVMMERFEPLTSAVDCNGDDGSLSLTFKSQAAFQHALHTWSFINGSKDQRFLLIANHDGCGPKDERQGYLITAIHEDSAKLTTILAAQEIPWSDVAGTYDLDFGRAIKSVGPRRRRGLISSIKDTISSVGEAVSDAGDAVLSGDADLDKSVTIPVNIGTPGEVREIVTSSLFSLNCTDCYVTGSFLATGHLSVKDFQLQDFSLSGSPQGLAAKLQVGTSITAPYSPGSLNYTKELFNMAIPEAGISVPKIFDLGTWVSLEVGVTTTFSGSASMNFGLSASIPDTAVVTANIKNPSASAATGFEGSQFDPNFDLTALAAGVTVAVFSQAKLSFGIDIAKVGRLEVALAFKFPALEAKLKAAYNEAGLCSTTPGSSKTGAQLTTDAFVAVDLQGTAKLGSDTTPNLSLRLFKEEVPLSSTCIPLAIPDIGSTAPAVTLAAAEVPEPIPTGVAVANA
ncbi:MAG: hypothetical protein Q9219_003927 [cf. Caloplaca sp. 3 TL-2023]